MTVVQQSWISLRSTIPARLPLVWWSDYNRSL